MFLPIPKMASVNLKCAVIVETPVGEHQMRMSSRELAELLTRHPKLAPDNQSPGAVMECPVSHGPLPETPDHIGYTGRYFVSVVSSRTRLLDEDNLAEKSHVDACRYAGLIPADSPDQTSIQATQVKVATEAEERTEIEITRV